MKKQSNQKPVVCVFCSSSDNLAKPILNESERFAAKLANQGFSLLYGGTTCGLMKVIADAHKKSGGYLIGVIPNYMVKRNIKHPKLDLVYESNDLRDRKQIMLDNSDCIVALPGGIGTYDEFFDLLALKQLKRHKKPMFLFNIERYFEPLMAMLRSGIKAGTIKEEYLKLFKVAQTANELVELIEESLD